jgi:hypothetical protein
MNVPQATAGTFVVPTLWNSRLVVVQAVVVLEYADDSQVDAETPAHLVPESAPRGPTAPASRLT